MLFNCKRLIFSLIILVSCPVWSQTPGQPNRQEWEKMVKDFGQSMMQYVSGEAWETALTGYINKNLYSKTCTLGIFDLEQPSSNRRLAFINMKNRNFLGATQAAHGTGGKHTQGAARESANHSLETFIAKSNVSGSYFTPIGFLMTGGACGHGNTSLDAYLRKNDLTRAQMQSSINAYVEVFGTMNYKIVSGTALYGQDGSLNNQSAEPRSIMLHEGLQCNASGAACGQSIGCTVPPLLTQKSLCENVVNKGKVVILNHKSGFAQKFPNYGDWQKAYPTLYQWYSGSVNCLDYQPTAFNNPTPGSHTPPQSFGRTLTPEEIAANGNVIGRGPEVIVGGSPAGTPFSGSGGSIGGAGTVLLMGALAVPVAMSLKKEKQSQVAEGSHEYKMCQTLSGQTLCESVKNCREGKVDSSRFGAASQVVAQEAKDWTTGEAEIAGGEMQKHIQECYAHDCMEQKSDEFVCAGTTVVDGAKLGDTLNKTTYDKRSTCDPGTFQTQDSEACRVALQEYDDFAVAEAKLHKDLEKETKINLMGAAEKYMQEKDKQTVAGDYQKGQLTGYSTTFSQLADFQLAKASVMTAHYNRFPTYEKLKEDCVKKITPYQNEGVDTYQHIVDQWEGYITSAPAQTPITEACDKVIAKDSSILIRNNKSREFVARVIDESLSLEKKYRDAASDLSNNSLEVGDIFNKLKSSGVIDDLEARKRELKKCEEDDCFKRNLQELVANNDYSSDPSFSSAFNYRNRFFQSAKDNTSLTSVAGANPQLMGQLVESLSQKRKDNNELKITKPKNETAATEIPELEKKKNANGIYQSDYEEKFPEFYARSRYWRDHYDRLRTPDGTEVIDPISSKDDSLFAVVSQRYSYHFYELPKLQKVEGKKFFKTIGD